MKPFRRFCVVLALCAMLACGCDPVETELTLNADGSGRMTQRVHLTPAADAVLRQQVGLRPVGFVPILTEEQAEAWGRENAQGRIKVLSFSSAVGPDGARRVACEIAFSDLSEFAQSPWGTPLQLRLAETPDGRRLQWGDPAAFFLRIAGLDAAASPAPVRGDDRAALTEWAGREAALALGEGLVTRTTVHLPVGAIQVEGASASDDKRMVTAERRNTPDSPDTVFAAKPTAALLPSKALAVKDFLPAENFSQTRGIVVLRAEAGKDEGYEFRINHMNTHRSRTINFEGGGRSPQVNQSMNLGLQLFGPAGVAAIDMNQWDPQRQGMHLLTAARDDKGNDLAVNQGMIHFNVNYGGGRRGVVPPGSALGGVHINLAAPPVEATRIAVLEGYVTMMQVLEEGRTEVRPLSRHLNRDIDTPSMVLRILDLKENSVEIAAEGKGRPIHDLLREVQFVDGAGKALPRPNHVSSSQENARVIHRLRFQAPFPEDGGLVLTYPTRVRELKVPFAFKDIPLP